ncbi:hypothetical protein QR680_003942 [Steinernema hermaphroditum]|uniref:Uncharacterized protein n=1 Tax=Steinernema hermaphroditum TaxID=289476 RepID=A0AA39HNJ6_9BILA|nr:hypothetical protein QR680_003942 [Steinernema hermaphroditum]
MDTVPYYNAGALGASLVKRNFDDRHLLEARARRLSGPQWPRLEVLAERPNAERRAVVRRKSKAQAKALKANSHMQSEHKSDSRSGDTSRSPMLTSRTSTDESNHVYTKRIYPVYEDSRTTPGTTPCSTSGKELNLFHNCVDGEIEICIFWAGCVIDDTFITDSIEDAQAHADETFNKLKEEEKIKKEAHDEEDRKKREEEEKKRK